MLVEQTLERRLKPRISVSFPVTMRGITESGQKYEARGTLMNISASGMYIWTEKLLQIGEQVFITIQLSSSLTKDGPRQNCLTTIGNVVRMDFVANQAYGAAIKIDRYRFV